MANHTMNERPCHVVVYRGWPDKGKYTWSPFVTKVEFRCRHAGLRYEAEAGGARGAPKGKIPYVDLSPLQNDAATVPDLLGDSTFIIDRLQSMDCVPNLNVDLTDEQKLDDLAIRALCEDKLYFYHVSHVQTPVDQRF